MSYGWATIPLSLSFYSFPFVRRPRVPLVGGYVKVNVQAAPAALARR